MPALTIAGGGVLDMQQGMVSFCAREHCSIGVVAVDLSVLDGICEASRTV